MSSQSGPAAFIRPPQSLQRSSLRRRQPSNAIIPLDRKHPLVPAHRCSQWSRPFPPSPTPPARPCRRPRREPELSAEAETRAARTRGRCPSVGPEGEGGCGWRPRGGGGVAGRAERGAGDGERGRGSGSGAGFVEGCRPASVEVGLPGHRRGLRVNLRAGRRGTPLQLRTLHPRPLQYPPCSTDPGGTDPCSTSACGTDHRSTPPGGGLRNRELAAGHAPPRHTAGHPARPRPLAIAHSLRALFRHGPRSRSPDRVRPPGTCAGLAGSLRPLMDARAAWPGCSLGSAHLPPCSVIAFSRSGGQAAAPGHHGLAAAPPAGRRRTRAFPPRYRARM